MNTQTTHIPATRRLQRSRSDRMLAGVSGGLARYFEIHPAIFRVGFVVLTLLGGAGVLIYAAAALVMPDEGKQDSIATAALRNRRDRPWPLIGLGLLAVGGAVLLSRATLWPHGDAWWLLLVAGGLILWITRHPAADPAKDATELAAEDSRRVRRALRRTAIVLASFVALVLVAAAVFAAVFHVHVGRGIGDHTYTVTTCRRCETTTGSASASSTSTSARCSCREGETHVETSVDVGDLQIIVPDDVALRVHAEAQAGYVEVLGGNRRRPQRRHRPHRDRRPRARARRPRRRRVRADRARRTMSRHAAAHVRDEL